MARRPLLLVCVMAALAACSPEASAYKNPFDRLVVQLGLVGWSGYYPCSYVTDNAFASLDSEDCYRFERPRRMRGVWLLANETSELLPDARSSPAVWDIMDENQTFLEIEEWEEIESLPPPIKGVEAQSPNAYAIEFIGRRARYPGLYGGGAGARHMVIMDKLLSARAIVPPRPPDWPAIVAEIRRADAARQAKAPRKPVFRCPFFLCPSPRPADRIEE